MCSCHEIMTHNKSCSKTEVFTKKGKKTVTILRKKQYMKTV